MTVTPIIPRQCFACQRWTGENYCEPFVLEEAEPDKRLWLCDSCLAEAEDSEKYGRDPLTFLLSQVDLEDGADDSMGSVAYDEYVARIGDYLLVKDSQGYVSHDGPYSPERMDRRWSELYDAGLAADQDDAYIEAARDGYAVSFGGKHLGTYPRLSRALARVSLAAIADGYYPNCWLIGERGDLQRIDYW